MKASLLSTLLLSLLVTLISGRKSLAEKVADRIIQTASLSPESLSPLTQARSLQLPQGTCPRPLVDAVEGDENFIPTEQIFAIILAQFGVPQAFEFNCGFKCSGTMVNDEEVKTFGTMTVAVGATGFLLALFIFVTWGMFSVKSKQKMTFWVSFASVCVTSFVFFPALFRGGDAEDVWCKDEVSGRTQQDGISACVLQGMAIVFFGLVLCAWWWCSCFDLFCKLYLRKRNIQHFLFYYHVFSWTLPTICTLIILATGNFGYEQPRLWCFLSPEAPDSFEYIFFYGWVGALWISGTIMMMLVIWSIIAQSASRKGGNRTNYLKKLSLYQTPMIFVFVFSFFWAIFFSFVLLTDVNESDYIDSAASWFFCLLGAANINLPDPAENALAFVAALNPAPEGNQLGCGFVQPGRIPPGLLTIAVLCLNGNGILMFIVFGLQKENFILWKRYIGSGCDPESVLPKSFKEQRIKQFNIQKPMSTFKEIRVGIAKFTIFACEKFAGIDSSERFVGQDVANNFNYEKNILNPTGMGQEYIDQQFAPGGNYLVSPLPSGAMEAATYPRISYQQQRTSADQNDPFPTRNNGQPPPPRNQPQTAGLQQFYRNSPPPPGFNDNRVSQTGWSDVYNDPLWGVNVEF